jgi:hypothetical protein
MLKSSGIKHPVEFRKVFFSPFQIDIIEKHIETHLVKKIPDFSMDKFIEQLQ